MNYTNEILRNPFNRDHKPTSRIEMERKDKPTHMAVKGCFILLSYQNVVVHLDAAFFLSDPYHNIKVMSLFTPEVHDNHLKRE